MVLHWATAYLLESLDVFRERVDFAVENSVPAPKEFLSTLKEIVRLNQRFIESKEDEEDVRYILGTVSVGEQQGTSARQAARQICSRILIVYATKSPFFLLLFFFLSCNGHQDFRSRPYCR
jgi:hypothetical protein